MFFTITLSQIPDNRALQIDIYLLAYLLTKCLLHTKVVYLATNSYHIYSRISRQFLAEF